VNFILLNFISKLLVILLFVLFHYFIIYNFLIIFGALNFLNKDLYFQVSTIVIIFAYLKYLFFLLLELLQLNFDILLFEFDFHLKLFIIYFLLLYFINNFFIKFKFIVIIYQFISNF